MKLDVRKTLALLLVALLALVLILLAFREMPEGNKDAMLLILGALIREVTSVYQHFFPNSKSAFSEQKAA